jgi:arginine transport system substrate-binding protein
MMRLLTILFLLCHVTLTAAETLKIGVHAFTPPLSMVADQEGDYNGFSVEIMTTICKRLKANCIFQSIIFPKMFAALETKQIDLAVSNITITKAREKFWLFSLPYLASPAQFIVRSDSKINNINELFTKKIGAQQSSDFIPFLKGLFGDSVKLVIYPQGDQEMAALTNKEVDAVITDGQVAEYWRSNNSNLFKLLGKPIPLGLGYGIMALKSSEELIGRINKIIVEMGADGTYLKIYDTYFGS